MPIATEEPVAAETFRSAVIGGGIGGLTTALSIATYRVGCDDITVYEQAPEYGEIGARVGIGIQAGRVLQKLGVWDAANAISGDRGGVHRSSRCYDNDEVIVDVPAVSKDGLMNGVGQLWVHRAEFFEVLYNEVRQKGYANLETNKRARKLEVCSANQKDSLTPYLGVY